MVAFVLALPYILFQAWGFIAPGLYAHEKRLGIPLIFSSTLLFLAGMSFCYFFVFGQVFGFINSFAPKSITPAPDIEAYLSFVMTMFLASGIAFEVPVALVVLVKLGVVTVEKLKEMALVFYRRCLRRRCRGDASGRRVPVGHWPFRCVCSTNWVFWLRAWFLLAGGGRRKRLPPPWAQPMPRWTRPKRNSAKSPDWVERFPPRQ